MEKHLQSSKKWAQTTISLIRHYVSFANWAFAHGKQHPSILEAKSRLDPRLRLDHSVAYSSQLIEDLKGKMKM